MIAIEGVDIDISFMRMRKFIEKDCIVGLCLVGRGDALTHSTFSIGHEGELSCLLVLNKKFKVCLEWDVSPPARHVVLCKKLRGESLHSFRA